MMMLIVGICLMTLASVVAAQAPASSWLTYAHTTTGKPIQSFYAELIVPSYPRVSGGSPAFWIGIEDRKNLNLIQPVRLANLVASSALGSQLYCADHAQARVWCVSHVYRAL